MMTVRAIAFAFCWMCAGAGLVRAHSIVVHTGTVRWAGAELAIEIESDPHSIRHEIEALGEEVDAQVVLERLARSIAVVCDDGAKLSIDHVEHLQAKAGIKCTYKVPKHAAALALFHHPGDDAAPLARQIQLRQVAVEENGSRHLRLTSRGNYEVLLRERSAIAPAGIDPFNQPIIRVVANDDAKPRIQIDYPCTLLSTWPSLVKFDSDSISSEQVERFKPHIIRWVEQHLSLTSQDNETIEVSNISVSLIGPSDDLSKSDDLGKDDSSRQFYLLTSRVRVEVPLSNRGSNVATSLTWTGFNAAVLQMPMIKAQNAQHELVAVLTRTQPTAAITIRD
ncbi:MAG TPA: hypothetical protein PKN33_15220 [Phycisphaerae bacterium]|nr:hypothetical protein [Phycisphaerae bacterium]